ncbi:translation initiation factor eIF-2B epsilon subunit, GEF [Cryptotrichosporon argae]
MPPKKQQPLKAVDSKAKQDVNVDNAPLQAVVLADSYNRRFEVLCTNVPRVLLPLCSTPLLAWTLESLAMSKVEQVFIFCGAHADKIREYVEKSPYSITLDIVCLSSRTAFSAGDALRELDDMHLLNPENPFILVHSPLVGNYNISQMVEKHKKRRETDKNYIMTMGVGRGGRRHPESPIMFVHPESSRLLHYILSPLSPAPHRITIPSTLFVDPYPPTMDTYEVWAGPSSSAAGYRDLGVDICEADVPALCTENFDYHDLRRHFLNGVLTSELLGKKIAVHLVGADDDDDAPEGGQYIERVRDTRTFGDVTRDVLRRWAFPLVPDINEPGGVPYELRKGNVYIARNNVLLSRTTTLHGPLLIGPRSTLSHNTLVHQSTLGADCAVGHNTRISRSYIFSEVRVGADCVLDECIVGDGVVIADGCRIGKGALLGNGVRIGKDVTVPEFLRIGATRYVEDEDDDEGETEDERDLRISVLGPESLGYIWPSEEAEPDCDSDEEDDPYEHPSNKILSQLGRRLSLSSAGSSDLSTLSKASTTPPESPASLASDADLDDVPLAGLSLSGPPPAFHTEARASLERAYDEGHTVENALLELKTLVMGYNSGIDAARKDVVDFLLSKTPFSGGAAHVLAAATGIWARWGGIVDSLTRDGSEIVVDAQAYCAADEHARPWFGVVCRALYEADVVDEDALVEWRSLSAASEGAGAGVDPEVWDDVYRKGKAYVDALEEMESGSDEDDEDGDEDGESDDE